MTEITRISVNKIQIPKCFMLGGCMIDVVVDNEKCEGRESLGLAEYDLCRISLKEANAGVARPPDDIERVFFHELLHYIFHYSGEEKLADDEVKIDRFARLLHQSFKTMIY